MVIFSTDPKEGYLTKVGIRQVKSAFARRIYQQDLLHVYEQKTVYRDTLQRKARQAIAELVRQMKTGTVEDSRLGLLLEGPAKCLHTTKGKKVYGYLPSRTKAVVDEIVDLLAQDRRVAQAYELWYQMREEICRTYLEALPERLPLSRQKEFKTVRNLVVREALRLSIETADHTGHSQEVPTDSSHAEETEHEASLEEPHLPEEIRAATLPPERTAHQRRGPNQRQQDLAAIAAIARLFHDLGQLFESNCKTDLMHRGIQMDRKRRRQLLEKRLAMGHKADDHEEHCMI